MTRTEYQDIYNVVGACYEVYNQLGRGLEEPIYQEALQREFRLRNMDAEREKVLHTWYKGELMDKVYQVDFSYHDIMIELKSVDKICTDHRAQLFNYMRISKVKYGLLVNFGGKSLYAERYMYDTATDDFILITIENYKQLITDI